MAVLSDISNNSIDLYNEIDENDLSFSFNELSITKERNYSKYFNVYFII